MKRKEGIEVVFFDAAGTLIYLPDGVGRHYRLVAERHGLQLDEMALNRAFQAAWDGMPARGTTKTPRPNDDKIWWRELVARVLEKCDADGKPMKFDEYFEDLYNHFARPGVWQLSPETCGALASLGGKYRLAVISNFDKRLRTILGHLGIAGLFEVIIISSEVGADKPDPHIFESALSAMGVPPARAVHVGDDPRCDWQAAEAAGMVVFRLNRPENSLAGLNDFLESKVPCGS